MSPAHEIAEMRSAWWAAGSEEENRCCTLRPATVIGLGGPGTFEIETLNSLAGQPVSYAAASAAELTLRRLDPELRRLVSSYARRRPELSLPVRVQLASQVQSSLKTAMPDVFAESGPLATLDRLADLESQ